MRLFEYQGKELFKKYNIKIPFGEIATDPGEAAKIAGKIGGAVVLKAQVLAGGRGKSGGIKFATGSGEVEKNAKALFNGILSGSSTRILVEEKVSAVKELYMGISVDRSTAGLVAIASSKGGMDIEETANLFPNKVIRQPIDIFRRIEPYQARDILRKIGLRGNPLLAAGNVLCRLTNLVIDLDATLAEINPLIITKDETVVAADAKVVLDDAALYRHPGLPSFSDNEQGNELERKGAEGGLTFVVLDGNIGVLGGGAGLCMTTVDLLEYYGGKAANFVDMGGAISSDDIALALNLILDIPNIRGIIIAVFGGANNCEIMARGIVRVLKERQINVPLVVKMLGHFEDEGWAILEEQGINLIKRGTADEAVQELLRLVEE